MICKMKTKQLRWLAAMLMLVAAMVVPSTAWAQTMYTVFDTETGTLTFKYDGSKPETSATQKVYDVSNSSQTPTWITNYGGSITKVVFEESFKNARPETCYDWFNGCKQLTEIEHLDYLNTENVRSMRHMFKNCSSLTSLDVSNFNTQNVQLIEQMFYNCSSLTSLDVSNFDTQNVTYMESVFTGCSSLTSLNVSNFNTQKVTNMLEMFNNCSSLISLDLSNFNTQKVTYMSNMFYNCNRLKVIFVSENFTTTAVTSSNNMFYGCTNLKGAIAYNSGNSNNIKYANYTNGYFTNVSEKKNVCFYAVYNSSSNTLTFKYGNRTKPDANETAYELNSGETAPGWINNNGITKVVFDYSFNYTQPTSCFQWFKGLSSLTTIEGIGYLNTSEVTTMKEMFPGCSNLASLQLKTFNTAKVTNMPRMFYNCSSLKTIYTSNLFDVSGVTVSEEMFTGCTSLVGAITYDAGKVTKDYANNETGYFTHEPEGEGTSESPFLIKTAKDLAWFRDHVNAGNRTACARLEADINMSSVCHAANTSEGVEELMWVPISDYSQVGTNSWYGTFDGNNKTISNLYINATANYSGLFGYLNNNVRGTIKNIKFENANINSTKERVAVLVGFTRRTDISGIMVNSGTVKGKAYCGGIAGEEDGSSISHCVNKADIEGTEGKVGGIVGYINSAITITNCANYGNVKGLWMVGGIAGRLPSSTLENVFTSGNVTYTNSSKRSALVVGSVDTNLTLSGYVIYNSDAKLYYKTNVQPTQAFDGPGSVTGEGKAIGLTADQLKNGWGAWLLNAEKADGAWGQTIDTDDYPTLGGSPVYPQDAARNCIFTDFTGTFTNTPSEATVTFTHDTPTYHPAVPNICTDGNVAYYECNDCHRTYKDEAMTQLIEDVFLPRQYAHHDFGENFICKNCSTAMPVVSLGDTDVTIDKTDDNDTQYGYNLFKYVADGTGTLYVKAYGDADTEGALWTALGSEETEAVSNDNESTEETDFSLTYAVTQGETYIIGVRQKSKEAISGNYILRLRGSWTTTANREGLEPFFIVGDGTEASPYELSDASCLTWFANFVNGGKTTACAILTNDITFTGNFTAIGKSESNPYTGTFDGKGHTVTVNQNGSADVALFGQIGACTIKNMKVTGTINTSVKYAAGFAMHKQGTGLGTIENCISDVVIESTVRGDGTHGGIIGVVDGGTLNINNCAVTGAINGSSTSCCGGIVGWTNASSVINNTYVSATFTVSSEGSNIVSRNESKATATNCYYVNPLGGTVTGITQVNEDDVTSGKLCMTINNGTSDGSKPFGQQLGTDNYPVPGSPYKLITTAKKTEDGTYWATFSDLTTDVTLSVPSTRTLKVYNATVSGGTLTLSTRTDNQVAMGEGVLLKTDGKYVNVKANETNVLIKVDYVYNNLVATPVTAGPVGGDANYTLYRLTYNTIQNEDNLGFYLGVATVNGTTYRNGSYVNATPGKAYLKVATATVTKPSGASIRGFVFPGDDGETTGIECITVTDESMHRNGNAEGIFDLQGRKVSKPAKGVYINNGKKVIIK